MNKSLGWKWLPTPVFLPGEFHGQRSLAGYSPWGGKESDIPEQLYFHIRNYLCIQQASIDTFINGGCATYSMKRWAMPCRATQHGRVMMERSDKTWSTGEENGKPLQHSCLENPMNSMKKIWHWKMNSPGRQVSHMLLEISGEITPERVKRWSQSKNNTQLWMWLMMELKSNAVKNNIA